jgi:arylsulfatase A-like enzyme
MSYTTGWRPELARTVPTLAEYLHKRGYLTAGFVANTVHCSYESGLDRGFLHYEDYPLSGPTVLGSSAAGHWILERLAGLGDPFDEKWVRFQSRDARGINSAFLRWLSHDVPADRPFFAFLNYLDAHDPYVLPRSAPVSFGSRPVSPRDSRLLMRYWELDKRRLGGRDVALVQDAYDDCIAYLDRQVGALLDELSRRGTLENTVVIITSDHGEELGEHGLFGHSASLYLHELHVPLIVLTADPAGRGRAVREPVSLLDVPATVVGLLGLEAGSPLRGASLAGLWGAGPALARPSPVLADHANPPGPQPQRGPGTSQAGFVMSLLAGGQHYIRDSEGREELYDLGNDPQELANLTDAAGAQPSVALFRAALLRILSPDAGAGALANEPYYLRDFRLGLAAERSPRSATRTPRAAPR